jgi:hypothetical protein
VRVRRGRCKVGGMVEMWRAYPEDFQFNGERAAPTHKNEGLEVCSSDSGHLKKGNIMYVSAPGACPPTADR